MASNLHPGVVNRMWALDGAWATFQNHLLVVGGSGETRFPIPCYLIEHPKGLVLFDTGMDPAAAGDPEKVYGHTATALRLEFPAENGVDTQIKALGYRLEDVTHVIASHGHLDHVGGLYLFKHAKMYIGEGDIGYTYWPPRHSAHFFRGADFDQVRDADWTEVAADYDLFGDGSIVLLHLPGHTPGSLGLLVRLADQPIILTGDVVHLRDAVERLAPMATDYNTGQAVRSIRRLAMLRDSLDAAIWIAHDPEDWADFDHGTREYK